MTRRMYKAGKTAFLSGDIDLINADITAALINLDEYTPDTLNDATLADIPEAAILSECLLTGKMLTDSDTPDEVVFDSDDVVFPSVEEGFTGGAVVIFLDEETVEDTRLICIIDDADGLPAETSGENIEVIWADDGILGI